MAGLIRPSAATARGWAVRGEHDEGAGGGGAVGGWRPGVVGGEEANVLRTLGLVASDGAAVGRDGRGPRCSRAPGRRPGPQPARRREARQPPKWPSGSCARWSRKTENCATSRGWGSGGRLAFPRLLRRSGGVEVGGGIILPRTPSRWRRGREGAGDWPRAYFAARRRCLLTSIGTVRGAPTRTAKAIIRTRAPGRRRAPAPARWRQRCERGSCAHTQPVALDQIVERDVEGVGQRAQGAPARLALSALDSQTVRWL